ncbi:MAG: hypothetical protein GC162_07540 [Planctomycetes bacterium]|nr:hypothetical protein [Planctomycetota bacterium]
MSDSKSRDMRDLGYDAEDAYFHEKDQEAVDRLRQNLTSARKKQAADQSGEPHWLRCPKCGAKMAEVAMGPVKVDRCGGCGGVYFDAGELELLLKAREPKGVLSVLGNLLTR